LKFVIEKCPNRFFKLQIANHKLQMAGIGLAQFYQLGELEMGIGNANGLTEIVFRAL